MSRTILLICCLLIAAAGAAWLLMGRAEPASAGKATVERVEEERGPGSVACLGRFQPQDGTVRVAAPYYQSRPSVVARLLVKEGKA